MAMASIYKYLLKRKRPTQPSPPPPSTTSKDESELSPGSFSETSVSVDDASGSSVMVSQTEAVVGLDLSDDTSNISSASNRAPSLKTVSFFDNIEEPCQPSQVFYPKRSIGGSKRSFNKSWFVTYRWLEYNQDMDACFCFPCRVFLANSAEKTFTQTGFRDWKNSRSTGSKKGLSKHDKSNNHQHAMALWADRDRRKRENKTIWNAVSQVSLEQQEWLYAVFHVTNFWLEMDCLSVVSPKK